jgi:hypothetical protein
MAFLMPSWPSPKTLTLKMLQTTEKLKLSSRVWLRGLLAWQGTVKLSDMSGAAMPTKPEARIELPKMTPAQFGELLCDLGISPEASERIAEGAAALVQYGKEQAMQPKPTASKGFDNAKAFLEAAQTELNQPTASAMECAGAILSDASGACPTEKTRAAAAIIQRLLDAQAKNYEEVLADKRRVVRELDVLLNGEEGAAKQASLIDLFPQIEALVKAQAPTVLQSDKQCALEIWDSGCCAYRTKNRGRFETDKAAALIARHRQSHNAAVVEALRACTAMTPAAKKLKGAVLAAQPQTNESPNE